MRCGWPLKYFKTGETKSYVFPTSGTKGEEVIEDYGDDYKDNKSFCELIHNFVWRATESDKYATKIMDILAMKLGVYSELLDKPKTDEEVFKLMSEKSAKLMKKLKNEGN